MVWQFAGALAGALILSLLSLLHVYWAFGGRFGVGAVVPERAGVRLFQPSRGMTLLVAGHETTVAALKQLKVLNVRATKML